MFVQGKCYNCGGFLAVDDTQDASVCPFCNKAFIVEKAISSFSGESPHDIEARRSSSRYVSDFVVDRGILIHYNGFTEKDVKIPAGISIIGESAFQGMNNIESVHIPEGVETIRAGAFSGCKKLKNVFIPDSMRVIERDSFNGSTGLKEIRLPDGIRTIEAGTFAGCTGLESVNIPHSTEILPWRVFEGCTSLKHIVIPRKVRTLEDCAFAECTALERVEFEGVRPNGDHMDGINRIGMNAFRNCTSLKVVVLPETLRYIGNQAFRGCTSLREICIPGSVKAVYPLAFADCTALEKVTFSGNTALYKGSNPYKDNNNYATFFNCPKLLDITYSDLQRHFWAFPAYITAQEPVNISKGRCRHCGGEFKGLFDKVCTVCRTPKDY